MIRFECDYAEGAHPRILQRLAQTNLEQTPGYGEDAYCERAKAYLLRACGNAPLDVHFLTGGTQTNLVMLCAALRPHQAVIAAQSGHIAVHETGSIEATGHKVITLASADGKLSAQDIRLQHRLHQEDASREHTVQPRLVYISHPTETGTAYTKEELQALRAACDDCGFYLYLDGARLGYALDANVTDLTLTDIAALCDAFYIGGTKVGALLGEALLIRHEALKMDFRYLIKQRGALLAKGRILGIQFEVLFEDGLYMELGAHAVAQALRIRAAFLKKGVELLYHSKTNQQFPILNAAQSSALRAKYAFAHWGDLGPDREIARFCTSWATRPEDVDALVEDILQLP